MLLVVRRFQKEGIVKKEGRANYQFTDNLFAEWLKFSDEESNQRFYR